MGGTPTCKLTTKAISIATQLLLSLPAKNRHFNISSPDNWIFSTSLTESWCINVRYILIELTNGTDNGHNLDLLMN